MSLVIQEIINNRKSKFDISKINGRGQENMGVILFQPALLLL